MHDAPNPPLSLLSTGEGRVGVLPGGVRALLHSRLAAISQTGAQLLSSAAIIGRSFDFDTLREASGRSEEETIAALEELLAHGLIKEVNSQSAPGTLLYDFSHEKLRALVYEETSLARRRLMHRRVAEALVNRVRGHEASVISSLIAQHYQLAGQEAKAADYFKLAGEHARRLYANEEALNHFRTALALGHPETAALHEAIGDLAHAAWRIRCRAHQLRNGCGAQSRADGGRPRTQDWQRVRPAR